jgi:hypothetical protein
MEKLEDERIEIEIQISWNFHMIIVPNDTGTYIHESYITVSY